MKKVLIGLLIVLIILGILFVGAELYLNAKGGKIIANKIAELTDSTCIVTIGKTSVNLLHRSATLQNVSFEGKDITINGQKSGYNSLNISTKKLSLGGIRYKRSKKDSLTRVSCKLLLLDSPIIISHMSQQPEEENSQRQEEEQVAELLFELGIDKLSITNALIELYDETESHENIQASPFESLNLTTNKLALTGIKYKNDKKNFNQSAICKKLDLDSPSIVMHMSKYPKEREIQEEEVMNNALSKSLFELGINNLTIRNAAIELYDENARSSLKSLNVKTNQLTSTGIKYSNNKEDTTQNAFCEKLDLDSPYVIMHQSKLRQETEEQEEAAKNEFSALMSEWGANDINIRNGHVEIYDETEEKGGYYRVNNFYFGTQGLKLKGDTIASERFNYDRIQFSADIAQYMVNGRMQLLELDSIRLDSRDKNFAINNFRLIPQVDRAQYAYVDKNHADWIDIKVGTIDFEGVDYEAMLEEGIIRMDKITINGADLDTYKNRKISKNITPKKLFHESMHSLPFKVDINEVTIKNMKAQYEELAENGDYPGKIYFTDINGTFHELTNIVKKDNQYIQLEARGKIMGQGQVNADFYFPVNPENTRFEIAGSLGNFNMPAINTMVEPLAKIDIKDGIIQGMSFNIVGWTNQSKVTMELIYDNLEVMIYKEKDDELKPRRFLSFLANEIIIKDSNPDRRGTRIAEGEAVREHNKSQFNYLWKSLLPGIKATVGVPGKDGRTYHVDPYDN